MSREVEAGSSITLYAEFYDVDVTGNKVLKDPDTTPLVSIYDALHDPRDSSTNLSGDARVYRTSATQVTTGIYSYTYTVPSNQITNWWFDMWEATIDGLSGSAVMQFLVSGTDSGTTPLGYNMIVQVTLDSSIADTDGNELGDDYEFWFTTQFDPMYSDPVLIKLYAGNWVKEIPDETLLLMLYESSKLADDITPANITINTDFYNNARSRFVTADAVLRLLSIPVNQGGLTKQLGDLMVKRDGASFMDMINRIQKERDEWYRVVNAGGNIGPGESLGPMTVVKGERDPDRLNAGRLWIRPGAYDQPGANTRVSSHGKRLQQYTNMPWKNSRTSNSEDNN